MNHSQQHFDASNLDFTHAKAKHLLFKNNLRSILYDADIDQAPVLSKFECELGKWIYGHAIADYGHLPQMLELEEVHAEIHACARNLISKYKNGEVEEARNGLGNMETIADKLVSILENIETEVSEDREHVASSPAGSTDPQISYQELVDLHKIINDLDNRIKEQTLFTDAARNLAEANENKFRNSVMQAPVGMVILRGKDMLVEMANETYLAIVDKTAKEFVGKSLYETLPEVEESVSPLLNSILETGEPFFGNEYELKLNRTGDDGFSYFNFVYSPLRDLENHITGVMVVATEVTSQVKAKKDLELKDIQFRKMVSQSPVAMAILKGEDLIIDIANETMLNSIWRKSLEEVESKKLLDVFPELAGQSFPALLHEVYKTGKTYRENESFAVVNSSDGTREFYLNLEYSALKDLDDEVFGIMVTANDVTGQVIARKELERAEKKYRDLLEILPIAICTIDDAGFITYYNKAAEELWQRKPVVGVEKWVGAINMYYLDHTPIPFNESPIALSLRNSEQGSREIYLKRPNGELRHVITHPQPIKNEEGLTTGAINVLIDITGIKDTEKALMASEEKFRLLANFMPQFIWTSNSDGELDYFSQTVYDYTGMSEEQVFRKGWLSIVHPDDRDNNVRLWLESIKTGNDFIFEHRFLRHDGNYRWQLSRALPQRDANGKIQMWVGTSTDIHDRTLFLDELKEKVDERTRELTVTNEDLLKSNAELAQFAYVASHDLQEPLRKIKTFITRILEVDYDKISVKGKDYFDRIFKSTDRIQNLIQDLLSFSRSTAVEKIFTPIDLNEMVKKIREDLSLIINQKNVVIISGILPVINGIDFQVEQLFTNLLTNAIKFSKNVEDCVINISASIETGAQIANSDSSIAGKKYHHIMVEDNGIGFEPEFNERIFLVFQRLHSKESYEGTGIGLAICKKIIDNHNGFITASGKPGKGAFFNIYLPVDNEASVEKNP